MKKISTLVLLTLLITRFSTMAQAPKYALFEHFTQASCPPCAAQNPGFQYSILEQNPNTVRHIAYHTWWPGYDPMHDVNAVQSDSMVDYYGVSGVPDIFLMGNVKEAQPGGFTQQDVDDEISQTSPIKIIVSDVDNGTVHDVTVTIESVGIPPSDALKLRTAIIERNVNYSSPPGTNGEKYFPNVFRMMLPSTEGDDVTLASQGSSVSFTYSYDEDPIWNMDEIGIVSFVQNDITKEILNCGATFDPSGTIANPVVLTHAGVVGSPSTFLLEGGNQGEATADFSYTLSSDAPADWTSDLTVNGTTYPVTTTVTVAPGSTIPVNVNITPGPTPALAVYTLTVQSLANLNEDPVVKSVYVFSGITDFVVNNSAMDPTVADAITFTYNTALTDAGSTTYTFGNSNLALRAASENSLTGVKNIYYNVGWYFPAFTDDFVTQLMNFMNGGGNLFISGQDIGWDVWTDVSGSGHATQLSQDFYNDYMFSGFIADGDGVNKPLTANTNDPIFGSLGSTLINYYYGVDYFYPDQIEPLGVGTPIFYYNNNTAKVAGVRGDNGTYKTVYIAPGIEMLGTQANKTNIIKTAYDWFYGISGVQSVNNGNEILGQSFPNPANEITYIPVSGVTGDMIFTVADQLGRVMISQTVKENTSAIQVNTKNLSDGVYFYRIANAANQGVTKSMEVIH